MTAPDESATRAWDAVNDEIQSLAHRVEVAEWRAKELLAVANNLAAHIELENGDGILMLNRLMREHGLKGAE